METISTIKFQISNILKELGVKDISISISIPEDLSHGDYTTNVALQAFKSVKGKGERGKMDSPFALAQEIASRLTLHPLPLFQKLEAVKPGFINFYLSQEYLVSQMTETIKNPKNVGRTKKLESEKIVLEFADPNPFKEFHIGHLRNITVGETFARLLEALGATMYRVNYEGDVGMHVAKAMWGMKKKLQENHEDLAAYEVKPLKARTQFLGLSYAYGAKAYEEDQEAKKEVQELNTKIYNNDPEIKEFWENGRKWSLEHFEEIYQRVGTKFAHYYFESKIAPEGKKIVLDHIKDGVFEEDQGAVIFRGEKYGLHTRVFIAAKGYATYEGKDLALAPLKYEDVKYDRSIIITAHEQAPYFKVMLAALKLINPNLAEKTEHYSFGFVSLKEGKMSSRLGNIVTAMWLLDEAKKRIIETYKDIDQNTAELVAVGAIKYAMLKYGRSSDIAFSLEESISLEGDSGPYLQYAYVRTQSILDKRKALIVKGKEEELNASRFTLNALHPEELTLLRLSNQFNQIVEESAENFAPNTLAAYLYELAKQFNLFYQTNRILDAETPAKISFRLALTETIGLILHRGLSLLGIEAPKRM